MKVFILYSLFIFVFFTDNVGYSCDFRPYSGDIRVADINGRQIYTLFSSHLTNESDKVYEIVYSDSDPTNQIASLFGLLREHDDRVRSERSDFQQIRSLLTSQEINWIGIEDSPNMYRIEQEVQNYKESKENINASDGWNQEKTDDLLYLLYHIEIKLLAEYPSDIVLDITDTDKTRVIPLESETVIAKGMELINANERHSKITQEMVAGSENIYDLIELRRQARAFNNFIFNHPSFLDASVFIDPSDTEEFFTSSGIEDPEFRRKIRDYVDLWNENTIAQQERDAFVVQSILALGGNGLVLRGSAHQENVENGLTQACLTFTRSL